MNRKSKNQKSSRSRKIVEVEESKKIDFIKLEESGEENSEKEENSKEKFLLLDENDLKIISKKEKGKKTKTINKKRKRERLKSESKGSKSESESESEKNIKSKTKKKEKKEKIKKGIDFIKGKYNLKVELIEKDKYLEGKENKVDNSCCVVCSNRNCVRAAKTQNYQLMQNCINDRDHIISTLINPYSLTIGNSLEIAIENKDKKLIEMIFNSWNDDKDFTKIQRPRCYIENPKIQLINTGENSVYMLGVRTRKLNQTRGNKMGNDAFIRDDVVTNEYDIASLICKYLTEKCDDPSYIDFIKSLQFGKNSNNNSYNSNTFGNNNMNFGSFNNNRYYNNSNNLNFTFESFIINAVLKGNIEIAKYLLKDLEQNYNFGFNSLHYQVLGESSADKLSVKVKTSLTKKPQTNFGMTPMHVVCINPDISFR